MTTKSPPAGGRRILWDGPLFGRLSKSGRTFLLKRGWERLLSSPLDESTNEEEEPLAFIWPTKSGPQFPTNIVTPALVRPFPTNTSNCVDDKLSLWQSLAPYDIMPECIDTINDAEENVLYFVKHRYGAQGKSVHVHDKASLLQMFLWAKTTCNTNRNDFVIQQQVIPALDKDGRKFVLRGHVLVYKRGSSSENEKAASQVMTYAGLHKDVLYLAHALPYEPSAKANKAVHVSQAGKKHPRPHLISELASEHPAASLFPQIQSCSTILMEATKSAFHQDTIAPGVTCFALLGVDYLVSRDGRVKICEVNSHPALGWGSMRHVSKTVFERLIQETLDAVVFDAPLSSTGFVPIDI